MTDAGVATLPSNGRFPGTSFRGLRTLFGLSVRQHLHGKRWMVISALFSIPAALALLVRFTSPDVPSRGLEFLLGMMLLPQLLIPLVALLYASGMIEDEQEEQTITYLLVRPLPKWGIYIVKLLATATTTVALTITFTALTFAAIYLGAGVPFDEWSVRLAKVAGLHALAVTAYCSLFGLLSLLTKRALIVGVVYIAVIEGLLANLPFGIRLITVIYHARMMAYRSLSFVVTTPRRSEDMAAEAWQLNLRDDPQLLLQTTTSTSFMVLTLGTIVCAALAAWICSQREFYVKTPEKA